MISVVLPIFNENENIDVVAEAVSAELDRLARPYEVIFVDDGSTDGSFERLRQLAHLDSRIKVVRLSRNFGHQIAISAGLEFASGDAVIVMDADLQHPPELIPELVAQWEQGYDVVYTVREGRDHAGLLKRSSAAMFYWLMNRMCDIDIASNTPDFRLMNRRVVDVLLRFPERSRFLRGLVRWVGFRQKAVPFTARPRSHGRTKYPFARMLRFSVDGITAFSIVPLRLASYLGVLVALSGIPYASWAVYKRLFTDEAVHGWASLVVALLVIGGLLLVCIGIIGEYLGRIYEEVKGRPLYIADEVIGEVRAVTAPGMSPRVPLGSASFRPVRMAQASLPALTEADNDVAVRRHRV
jgi:dolichol-phosphate mannosyltransferase